MERIEHVQDCRRIQKVLEEHHWVASLRECEQIWEHHSTIMAAGWLFLPEDDDELWAELQVYVFE